MWLGTGGVRAMMLPGGEGLGGCADAATARVSGMPGEGGGDCDAGEDMLEREGVDVLAEGTADGEAVDVNWLGWDLRSASARSKAPGIPCAHAARRAAPPRTGPPGAEWPGPAWGTPAEE